MSDQNRNRSFEATDWGAGGTTDSNKNASVPGEAAFRSLYQRGKETTNSEEFEVSFVSKEKAKSITKNTTGFNTVRPARESLEEIEKQAYEKAFSEGKQAGIEEGRRSSQEIIDRLQGILADIETAWENLIRTHETQIIELVIRTVEKVVYGQASMEQEMVKRAIIEALRVVPEPVNVEVTLNPKDYEYIETVKEDFFSQIQALKDVSVIPDPAIHQGGCNVRTKFGEVDATLENRLEAVRECLLKANGKKV